MAKKGDRTPEQRARDIELAYNLAVYHHKTDQEIADAINERAAGEYTITWHTVRKDLAYVAKAAAKQGVEEMGLILMTLQKDQLELQSIHKKKARFDEDNKDSLWLGAQAEINKIHQRAAYIAGLIMRAKKKEEAQRVTAFDWGPKKSESPADAKGSD